MNNILHYNFFHFLFHLPAVWTSARDAYFMRSALTAPGTAACTRFALLLPHRALPSPIPLLRQSKLATLCTRAGGARDFVASVAYSCGFLKTKKKQKKKGKKKKKNFKQNKKGALSRWGLLLPKKQ
jgi:hypothetical protein